MSEIATTEQITKQRNDQEAAAKRETETRAQIMDALAASAGRSINEETGLGYHPAALSSPVISIREGTDPARAAKWLNSWIVGQAEEAVFQLPPTIKCRPWDGAVNVNDLLKKIIGMSSQGLATYSMFGKNPPQEISVEVGYNSYRQVPYGLIDMPLFEGQMMLGQKNDPEYGVLFDAYIKCPKKYKAAADGFWKQLGDHIKDHSIYKGAALVGAGRMMGGEFEHPRFLNPYAIDPNKVAYNTDVFTALRASVWGPIRTASLQRAAGLKLNRKTLLSGTYGTGKTLAGNLTARTAVNNGWLFLQVKTGEENIQTVLKTAELYAPAVVFIEDVDTLIKSDPQELSRLLEMFDGVSTKGSEVMILMTSNHPELLSKGMTRVGRIDASIEIGSLDQTAVQRFIESSFVNQPPYDGTVDNGVYEKSSKVLSDHDFRLPETMLNDDVDFEQVHEAMTGFEPAFISGTFDLAKNNAIIRTESLDFKLTTEDFVIAANTLRSLHDTHTNALDRPVSDTFAEGFKGLVREASSETLQGHRVDFREEGEIIAVASN